jgi:quinoprotein glucose dehydrogenase
MPDTLRAEAVASLAVWPRPSRVDRVDGSYHGAVERDPAIARAMVLPLLEPLLASPSIALRTAMADAAGRLTVTAAVTGLLARLRQDPAAEVRIAALRALQGIGSARLEEGVGIALQDGDAEVRMAGLGLVATLEGPTDATAELLARVLDHGAVREQQAALAALGQLDSRRAEQVLQRQLDYLLAGALQPAVQLDLIEAVEASSSRELDARLAEYRRAKPVGNPVAEFIETLHGGSAAVGQRVFQSQSAHCTQCHAIAGRGGDAGPELTRVGAELSRRQLLEALVDPHARIAPGYGIVSVTLASGERLVGTLREESATHLVVGSGSDENRRIAKSDIAERTNAPSPMPPAQQQLSRRELRDLVEYLSTLR